MFDNEEIMVPLIVFSSALLLVALVIWYQISKKRAFLRFLQTQPDLSPEAISAVGKHLFTPASDRRRAIFSMLIAAALWGFSLLVDFPQRGNLDLNHAIYGVGLFPFFTGLAYLILHRLEHG